MNSEFLGCSKKVLTYLSSDVLLSFFILYPMHLPAISIKGRLRYILSVLLVTGAFSICFADTWNGSSVTAPPLSGTTYTITTCAQLAWLAQKVNSGRPFKDTTFIVGSNLNLGKYSWTPIGNGSGTPFEGTFDGGKANGYGISNLTSSFGWYPTSVSAGMFGYVVYPAVIQNVTLSGITTFNYYNGSTICGVGGLMVSAQGSSSNPVLISNCSVSGTVTAGSASPAGAIVTTAGYATITNCSTSATITTTSYAGGIVGQATNVTFSGCTMNGVIGSGSQAACAGIAATLNGGSLTNCTNTSTITTSGYSGGLVGQATNVTFTSCTTGGTVTGTGYNTGAGGLTATLTGGSVTNCTTTAVVSVPGYAGGLVGQASNVTFSGCTAGGTVTCTGSNLGNGGVVGYTTGTTSVSSCSSTATVNGINNVGGLIGYQNSTGIIQNCTASGGVTASSSVVGGLIGNVNAVAVIRQSSYTGSFTPSGSTPDAGGLIGEVNAAATLDTCSFTGTFSGGSQYLGGIVGAVLANASFTGCSSSGSLQNGSSYLGGIAGYVNNASPVFTGCYTTGNISTSASYVGGFIGAVTGSGTAVFTGCYTTGSCTTTSSYLGGFIGSVSANATFSNCFATGNVITSNQLVGGFAASINSGTVILAGCYASGLVQGSFNLGGFVGQVSTGGVSIVNCYATGAVQTYNLTTNHPGGGFVGVVSGSPTFANCYAAGSVYGFTASYGSGGFAGDGGSAIFKSCFFDVQGTGLAATQASGQDNSSGITGITSTSTMTSTSFLDNSTYGSGVWSYTTGYYPELTNFKSGMSSSYTVSGITVPALTPSTAIKAWSALSVVTPFLSIATSDNSGNVSSNFTAPVLSSSPVSKTLLWAGIPQSFDGGVLSFSNNSTHLIYPITVGSYTYKATDSDGRIKSFFVYINKVRIYFVRSSKGSDSNSGASWTKAYATIQKAVESANGQNPKYSVWVAAGSYGANSSYSTTAGYQTYTGTTGAAWSGWSVNFLMREGVNVYGGFTEDGTTSNSNAGMSTRLTGGASILTGGSSQLVLAPLYSSLTSGFSTITAWDGFTITAGGAASDSVHYAATVPSNGKLYNSILQSNNGPTLDLLPGSTGVNLLIASNSGLAVAMSGASNLINATVVNNKGTAIWATGTPAVTNSILWNNARNLSGGATPVFTCCAASSNYGANPWKPGSGCIELYHRSPNFKKSGEYQLLLISPCLGTGLASADSLGTDIRGLARQYNNTIDMGAYQKWDGMTVTSGTPSTVTNVRAGYTIPLSSLTLQNDTMEVLVNPGITFSQGGNTALKTYWLELRQDTIANNPILSGGKITADSVLYVRRFSKSLGGLGVWSFFGLPYTSANLGKIDGAIAENSVRIDKYVERIRAANGANKSAWTHMQSSSDVKDSLLTGEGYALSFNEKVPQNEIGQTVIFPSCSPVTFDNSSATPSGSNQLSCTTASGSVSWLNCGWNLVANPLTQNSSLVNTVSGDWPLVCGTNSTYYGAVYLYQSATDSYAVYPLSTFNASGLSAFGACFLQTDTTGVPAVFNASAALTSPFRSESLAAVASMASSTAAPTLFRFTVNGAKQASSAYVLFYDSAHAEARPMEDAPVMEGISGNTALTLSTTATASNLPLAINRLPFVGNEMEIPLQVTVPAAGDYTITMPESDGNTAVYILDTNKGYYSLTSGYSFTAKETGTLNYTLVFGQINRVQTDANVGVTLTQDQTSVTITPTGTTTLQQVYVYSETGQLVKSLSNIGGQVQFNLPEAAGVYLVKISTSNGSTTKKLINR